MRHRFSILLGSVLVLFAAVVLPWSSSHPWSQAILYRRLPGIRKVTCEPLRCMNGAYIPTCDPWGRPVAFIQSPCRGR